MLEIIGQGLARPSVRCPSVPLETVSSWPILDISTPMEEAVAGRDAAETRRSSRVTLRVPMKVYERGKDQRFHIEEAYSLKVSLWGGLVALNSAVNVGQKLVVVNQCNWETKEARVVYLGPMQQCSRDRRKTSKYTQPVSGPGYAMKPQRQPQGQP